MALVALSCARFGYQSGMDRADREPGPAAARDRPLAETVLAIAAVTLLTMAVAWLGRGTPLDAYVHLAVGVLFLVAALQLAQRQPSGIERYGLALGGLLEPPGDAPEGALGSLLDLVRAVFRALPSGLRETAFALLVALVVFPPFILGFYAWHGPDRTFVLTLPDDLPAYVLTQLLVVGLPEEALFRGYAQSRLHEAFSERVRVLGAELSPRALVLQAALFALIHFAVDAEPARLAVFFPGLLFGWMRAVRGGIGAAIVFHASCNLLGAVLARGWL
jgi:membrane protease YdiL (CAAX protease family)